MEDDRDAWITDHVTDSLNRPLPGDDREVPHDEEYER